MPLPSIVLDTYLRYKTGTKTFVQWLASSARATGTVEDLFTDPVSGRKKGKARKESKIAPSTSDEPIHIPLSLYDKLANAVIGSSTATVPKSMLDILHDAISKREECAVYYARKRARKGKYKSSSADAGHAYCISTLKATLNILLRKDVSMSHNEKRKDLTVSPDLEDRFPDLHLTDANSDKTPASEDIAVPETIKTEGDYAVEPTKEDAEFAFFCMMKDITDIRFFVRRTWRKHKAGLITLETAAMTMNAAIQIVEHLNMTFLESFPKQPEFEHHSNLLRHIWKARWAAIPGGQEWEVAYTDGVQEIEFPSFACSQVAYIIDQLVLMPLAGFHDKLPQIINFKVPLANYEIAFWKILVEIAIVAMDDVSGVPADYVLKAMRYTLTHKKCPTWAIFALQCVRDTQLEFGADTTPRKEMRATSDRVQLAIVGYLASCPRGKNISSWHKVNTEVMLSLHNSMTYEISDGLVGPVIRNRKLSQTGRLFGDDFFFDNHHLMSGLYGQGKLFALQKSGTTTEATYGVIRTLAHLYNAAKVIGLLSSDIRWEDMEYYIEEMGDEHIFHSPRPSQGGDYIGSFLRSSGYYSSSSTPVSRLTKKEVNKVELKLTKGKNRKLRFISRYTQVCTTIKGGHASTNAAFNDAKVLLNTFCIGTGESADCKTPLETLTEFRDAMQEDQHRLRFNILSFWNRCNKLLKAMCAQVMQNAPRDYPASEYDHALGPIMVASSLLYELAGLATVDAPQFAVAARLMHGYIAKEGSVETEFARNQTRSSTIVRSAVEEEEPSFENPPEDCVLFETRIEFCGKGRIQLKRRGKLEEAFADGGNYVRLL